MVQALIEVGVVEDLDMSKCKFEGNYQVFADLLRSNKRLRTLSLMKIGLDD